MCPTPREIQLARGERYRRFRSLSREHLLQRVSDVGVPLEPGSGGPAFLTSAEFVADQVVQVVDLRVVQVERGIIAASRKGARWPPPRSVTELSH